ncbi:MAG TPA: prepilin-type N-terminal cleavage/methylation domain-containing protein [Tichowtungia sp.]|nr:prepilin-type N-terminal cleavage/methylation domain-containing protein [Tichowtungia sp.]
MKHRQGFTILEIMIVVAILSLLSAIGVPYIIHAYSFSLEKTKARNVFDVEKGKGVLTLPAVTGVPGAMGLANQELEIASDPQTRTNLCAALNIDDLDELNVGGTPIRVGTLSVKANYSPAVPPPSGL